LQKSFLFTNMFIMQANKLGSNPLIDSVVKQVVGADANDSAQQAAIKQTQAELAEALIERLKEQGIKSITYRFPVEEIAEFDLMIIDLQKALNGKRVNKNDVIRTGVNIVLEDWKKNKKDSLIYRVLNDWVNR